jgi:protein TorT
MDEAICRPLRCHRRFADGMTANNASIAKARAASIPVFELANDSRSDDLTIKITTSLREMGARPPAGCLMMRASAA